LVVSGKDGATPLPRRFRGESVQTRQAWTIGVDLHEL
jgi:hypothetical protein